VRDPGVDKPNVVLGRPPTSSARRAVAAIFVTVVATLAWAPTAPAFERDETPLPPSVTGASAGEQAAAPSGSGGSFVRMIVGLAIVLAVIYGIYWLLKAYARSKARTPQEGEIAVVATTPIGPNRSVHLLSIGDELVLVGAGEHGVTALRVYTAEEARRLGVSAEPQPTLRAPAPMTGTGMQRFVDELRRRTTR
jgi:flagellar protein FliO/FliZ